MSLLQVHRAICSNGAEVAVKLMNLESMNCDLDEIIHEAQTMRLYNHPNILPLYCSFVHGQELWMVMPFVSGGSVLHIMKYKYPEGLDETILATIGREVLKGLDYVHKNGSIHRDVKAGNILVDGDGNVKLGDFGVAASLERGGSWGHDNKSRMTFVGTPCWMAPEVMEQSSGYDFSADIWSFGITLLEMCHGHAPFAKFPPMKVLLMTLQNPAPTLEDKGKKHFSKALKDLVTRCLQKEKDKRPTAAQLLEHKFFKTAKDAKYLKDNLVGNLPPLSERVNQIRTGVAATNKLDNDRNLEKSQEEYRKGVSSWNFDLQALKAQAALEPDDETAPANMLPTISESDEREDTFLGATATAAAQFVAAQVSGAGLEAATQQQQAAESAAPWSFASAFATASGQDPTAKTNSVLPLNHLPTGSLDGASSSQAQAGTSGEGITSERSATPGGELPPQSPGGNVSPATGLSREGSIAGNMVGLATTPTAVTKQKKGRFEVSEHPIVPAAAPTAPAAPAVPAYGAPTPMPSMATTSIASSLMSVPTGSGPSISGGTVPDLAAFRVGSNAGGAPAEAAAAGAVASVEEVSSLASAKTEVEESVTSVEPKQRGRFKIVAEQGMAATDSRPLSKASSMANLSDAKDGKPRASEGGVGLMGKPPTAPNSIVPSVSVVLPKLQELLEHASAHQAALQKLIGAVQECDKGRVPLLLSRAQSTKSLFDGKDLAGGARRGRRAAVPSHGPQKQGTQTRELAVMEEENAKLRERNKVLETLHSAAHTVRFNLPADTPTGSAGLPSPALPLATSGAKLSLDVPQPPSQPGA
ncbi:hypothetical protein GPECTOR_1g330 [Gonium pectorale]|uniref:Protein kinase domain-containing protein n=1 Tax=Gonium pectorale TaxID=33097 RepID=A0A150H2Z0_GONPE|nr:hypothetical protein GPECTOR_1g330 [Gonium pectorale]|eukprot:KXZ56373.1 hypothetical protein GPECTOR_1g330 [Gonium pectorale]